MKEYKEFNEWLFKKWVAFMDRGNFRGALYVEDMLEERWM